MKQYFFAFTLLLTSVFVFAEPIPIEHFAKLPKYEDAVISPTGKYLAVTTRHDNGRNFVAILTTKDMKLSAHVPQYGKTEPFSPQWISNERLAVSIAETYGELDTPRANGEIYAMNADGSKKRLLAQHKTGVVSGSGPFNSKNKLNGYAWIIHLLPNDSKHVLVGYYPFGTKNEKKPHAYKINIFSSKAKRIAVAPTTWAQFITDAKGNITHTAGVDTSTNEILIHQMARDDWELIERIEDLGAGTKPIASISGTNELILEKSQKSGPSKLYKFNIDTQKYQLIYKHKNVDYQHLVLDRTTNKPVAIHFEPDYPDLHIIDGQHPIGQWYPVLYQAFGGKRVTITSATDDYKTLVLHVTADKEPGQFHLFDTEKKKLRFILQSKPGLDTDKLATTEPFQFKTSDDIELHGYITKPQNATGEIPLIVHPHGGPHGPRDYWSYSDDVQLLASRGYAVLQINFRGSGGYGNAFEKSGYHHWGDLIQQDIIEATEWAIDNQSIDPDRICIYGASFGGYSALMSPAIKPDLFKCAIGYVGVYDLNLMWTDGDIQEYNYGETYLSKAIGKDKATLNKFSPLYNVGKIKAPVFLIHGEEDERVPESHFHAMKKALKKAGNPAETMLVDGEGHGFYKEENRQAMYERLLAFLDEHIGDKKLVSN